MSEAIGVPKCNVCSRFLDDWEGNVMAPKEAYYQHRWVHRLSVVCKGCTQRLDATGGGSDMHSLWELVWLRDNFVHVLGMVLLDAAPEGRNRWATPALDTFYELARLRLPYLDGDPLAPPLEMRLQTKPLFSMS